MRLLQLLFIFLSFSSLAQNVEISGTISSYAGKNICAYKQRDFITRERDIIKNIHVDSKGVFSFKYKCDNTEEIFIDAGYFNLSLFVYPGMKAEILIPKYKEIPKGDIFFKAVELPALVDTDNETELNTLILAFNKDLAALEDKYYIEIDNKDKQIINKIKTELKAKYSSKNKYFETYKTYSYGICELPVYTDKLKVFISKYFSTSMQDNSAYIDLFNKCFTSLLTYNEFKEDDSINALKLYNYQMKILSNNGIKDKEVSQYILLKSLHDNAFKPLFDKEIYIKAIEYLRDNALNNDIKIISERVLERVRYLSKGYACPFIEGKDYKSATINTKDYKGKYLYIMFFEKYSRMIEDELNMLASIADSKDYLNISIICDDNNKKETINFLKKYKLEDNAIFCKDYNSLKAKFKVVVAPSYFFVDKEGNIIQAHTIKPNEKLYRTLNQIHNKEIRAGWKAKNQYFK